MVLLALIMSLSSYSQVDTTFGYKYMMQFNEVKTAEIIPDSLNFVKIYNEYVNYCECSMIQVLNEFNEILYLEYKRDTLLITLEYLNDVLQGYEGLTDADIKLFYDYARFRIDNKIPCRN